MRKYKEITVIKKETDTVICNGCGKIVAKYTDYLGVDKVWGYGSDYDGEKHSFDLCEQCYEKLVSGFAIPIDKN
jgi:hypothetical protein